MRRARAIDQPIVDLATHPTAHVTVPVVCQYLEADARKVLRMIDAGALPAVKVGREWRILTAGLRQALTPVVSRSTATDHRRPP